MVETATIGQYRIFEPLGHGGMGIVYRARHISSERAVALKTVQVPAPKWLDSIRREIQALTRIRHPGVVRIVDHGVHEGLPWYAMDLVEGESLRRFGQRIWSPFRRSVTPFFSMEEVSATEALSGQYCEWTRTMTEDEPQQPTRQRRPEGTPPVAAGELTAVLGVMRRVCATLAFLHGEGFINGDLKPENVLLVGDQPIIIDFGLSAHHPGRSGREELEPQRGMSGTLPYMSPEQIRGEFLDARSDLYSFGCMLYELLTGAPPFTGAPRAVTHQHLSSAPASPSAVVSGMPPELERLLLRLLEKELTDRYGYADEVAAELAEVSRDARRLTHFPPVRSYLYRPRFVGRDEQLAELTKLRERAARGSGSLVLLGGESGVGKTRLAMELTRFAPSNLMRVVASEASKLSTESVAPVGPAPLHFLRSLLQAVADRCQEGGPQVTQRLLGHRRSVLAMYEPLFAHVPATGNLSPVIPLGADASRERLFRYLAETIACFAEEQPLLWVLDDVGWADELSLAFLRSLTPEYLDAQALLILCTYRAEEPSEALTAIAQLPHVINLTLPRLSEDAVHVMIGDMLALRAPLDGFVQFVMCQAEGNPFFVAEYLRTAVAERILHRDQQHSWQLPGQGSGATREYESIELPRSLLALIEHRLRKLSPAAHAVGLAAAVLGREVDLDTLREVAAMPEEAAASAVDELMRHQVLEQPEPASVRFAHDKLREVTYAQAPTEQIRRLHARAAAALESRWRDRSDARQQWAALGQHFAAAKLPEQAAHYFKLAADHARETYANSEAIRLYAEAINQVSQLLLRLENDPATWNEMLMGLHEAQGDVLALTGRRDEAREAYGEALRGTVEGQLAPRARLCRKIDNTRETQPEPDEAQGDFLALKGRRDEARAAYDEALRRTVESQLVPRARLYRKIGKTWETQHEHEDALRCYVLARDILGKDALPESPERHEEWIQAHIDQLWVYYWLGRVQEMDTIVGQLRPLMEKYGTAIQRVRFFQSQLQLNLRRDRYVVSEETLGFGRAAVVACEGCGALAELPMARFNYGLALLLHNSLDLAQSELDAALGLAQQAGDTAQEARCLAYLTLTVRRQHDAEAATEYTAKSLIAAEAAGMRDYQALARANQAWLDLKNGDLQASVAHANDALETWNSLTLVFPLQWMALLPKLEVALQRCKLQDGVECARAMLQPTQQYLPGDASDALIRAGRRWAAEDPSGAEAALRAALEHLDRAGYL
jgi:eukaryotic-like serine/threonine-protein kinase